MSDTTESRQLMAEGYTFHGAYSWDKDPIKKRAAELRKEGHKARLVYCPASKYSRGHEGGVWSVYWIESEASKEARRIATIERKKSQLERDRETLNELADLREVK